MINKNIPHFVIFDKFQKGGRYQDLLTHHILSDVALKCVGIADYTIEFVNKVNKGRLACLYYDEETHYISFSEKIVQARNSFFQSFPSALLQYCNDDSENKYLAYYILQPVGGSIVTDYHHFMYRLIKSVGTIFLNEEDMLNKPVIKFISYEDLILSKENIRKKNRSNKSTYVTKSDVGSLQIFSKVYGASKYESTLISLALYHISILPIVIYEIEEQGLIKLPEIARNYLLSLKRINIITSDIKQEEREYKENNSLRSPRYISNLLNKLGPKKCSLCDCDIPEIIQGAHIWPVSEIKKSQILSNTEKLNEAINGDNGIWLCQNHHKLFDSNLLILSNDKGLYYNNSLLEGGIDYLKDVTNIMVLPDEFYTDKFISYLEMRNLNIDQNNFSRFSIV
ncbi:HNH endonuclease signature motif containing protein [Colwellia sp. E2M01]|uniref:HNH endonuclease signature motif containing protein n=1 Tax=Colwellia sp. E2M01 TaxID=2841561 RepID=UPI001C0A5504|nr:HNH endonuclease signature motif containing protein [Colwellia sp. E2M01]MBU2870966.1 HNH endonuclease [Colwellia sp. E2M01]